MTRKRFEILKVAIEELGKHDRDSPPPGRYFGAGYNWCSEFVSFVYCLADHPFTEGSYSSRIEFPEDDGLWMQRTTTRIINWFKKHASYVARDDPGWYDIIPQAGDFVHIGRAGDPDRRHSGIVRYSSCDDHLYTIEGNNAGRPVAQYKYPYYRINNTENGSANGIVKGIGILPP